jgi:hypothetical protein
MADKAESYKEKSIQIIIHARLVFANMCFEIWVKISNTKHQQFMLKAYRMEHSVVYSLLLSRQYL